jgi:hypothetical protein
MNKPHHLIECGRMVFRLVFPLPGTLGVSSLTWMLKHPLDEMPTVVRLDASNVALVKGLSSAAHKNGQEV